MSCTRSGRTDTVLTVASYCPKLRLNLGLSEKHESTLSLFKMKSRNYGICNTTFPEFRPYTVESQKTELTTTSLRLKNRRCAKWKSPRCQCEAYAQKVIQMGIELPKFLRLLNFYRNMVSNWTKRALYSEIIDISNNREDLILNKFTWSSSAVRVSNVNSAGIEMKRIWEETTVVN